MPRQYTRETKVKICKMVLEDNLKIASIAQAYAMNPNMIHRWVNEYKLYGDEAFVGRGKLRPADARIKQLEKDLEDARMENEILKKAAAYFLKPEDDE